MNINCHLTLDLEAGSPFWIIQGIDFDLLSQGKTFEDAVSRFKKTVLTHFYLNSIPMSRPAELNLTFKPL